MSKEKKAQVIDRLEEEISNCSVGILTDYRGLSAAEITTLRRTLEEAGVEYRVVKNTLARFAAERLGRADLSAALVGPVAIAFGHGDVVAPAKVLTSYIDTTKSILAIKGGFIADKMLSAGEVSVLAKLPPREVLIAKVLGGMQSPIAALLNCLNAPLTGVARVLEARIKQLEGE